MVNMLMVLPILNKITIANTNANLLFLKIQLLPLLAEYSSIVSEPYYLTDQFLGDSSLAAKQGQNPTNTIKKPVNYHCIRKIK